MSKEKVGENPLIENEKEDIKSRNIEGRNEENMDTIEDAQNKDFDGGEGSLVEVNEKITES